MNRETADSLLNEALSLPTRTIGALSPIPLYPGDWADTSLYGYGYDYRIGCNAMTAVTQKSFGARTDDLPIQGKPLYVSVSDLFLFASIGVETVKSYTRGDWYPNYGDYRIVGCRRRDSLGKRYVMVKETSSDGNVGEGDEWRSVTLYPSADIWRPDFVNIEPLMNWQRKDAVFTATEMEQADGELALEVATFNGVGQYFRIFSLNGFLGYKNWSGTPSIFYGSEETIDEWLLAGAGSNASGTDTREQHWKEIKQQYPNMNVSAGEVNVPIDPPQSNTYTYSSGWPGNELPKHFYDGMLAGSWQVKSLPPTGGAITAKCYIQDSRGRRFQIYTQTITCWGYIGSRWAYRDIRFNTRPPSTPYDQNTKVLPTGVWVFMKPEQYEEYRVLETEAWNAQNTGAAYDAKYEALRNFVRSLPYIGCDGGPDQNGYWGLECNLSAYLCAKQPPHNPTPGAHGNVDYVDQCLPVYSTNHHSTTFFCTKGETYSLVVSVDKVFSDMDFWGWGTSDGVVFGHNRFMRGMKTYLNAPLFILRN